MKRVLAAAVTSLILAGLFIAADTPAAPKIPPGEADAKAQLDKSSRHGEFIDITVPGSKVPLKSFIAYPERKDKAPVVIVIMEIYGLSDWIRGVADQLAADGFIAIAPDMIYGKAPKGGGTEELPNRSDVTRLVGTLKDDEVLADLNAVREYGLKLPAASDKVATIGFCWGGGKSFLYAAKQPTLSAAVVYYGTPPADELLPNIKCPIFGFYGGSDARVTATVAPTVEKMKKLDKAYTPHVYDGAAHGFLRAQANEANLKGAQQAWPDTIAFLREHTK